ncbi:MAG: DUF308 domain-containing protein [Burkholderiales bacterium]|nr:DUF308 domain-containing protein [Burkholderiales bacterium]
MADIAVPDPRKAGAWVIVWGVLLIVAGACAILQPKVAALAVDLLLAWLLVFAGIVQFVYAIQERGKDGFRLKLLSAILTFLLGVFLLLRPMLGVTSIALLIGAFLFASGVSSVMLATKLKPKAGWGWVMFDGLLSIVIAALIAAKWPQGSIAFVGFLVGIVMIYGGVWRIMLGRALRAAPAVG